MNKLSKNYFECLYDSDDEEVVGKLPVLPDEIVNMIISYNLKISPTAELIKERFSRYYDGVLTIYEINALKELMDKASKDRDDASSNFRKYRSECYSRIREQQELCGEECERILEEHLHECTAKPNKCTKRYVAYVCEYECNGRCSHYFKIQQEEEDIEDYNYREGEFASKYHTTENEYKRELAKKEGWLDEYLEDCENAYESAHMDSMITCLMYR